MLSPEKMLGLVFCGFGAGILLAFFLPPTVLIIIEAAVIVAVGVLFSKS